MSTSYPTVPAFAYEAKGWDEALKKHPLMPFLLDHQTAFEKKDAAATAPFYTSDVIYIKPDGSRTTGTSAAKTLAEDFAFFPKSKHEPGYSVCTEDGNGGYKLLSTAKMYANLPGEGGEKNVKDLDGEMWEMVSQAAFLVEVVKDSEGPRGLKIRFMQTFSDTRPVLVKAVRKGVVPEAALMHGVE